MNRCRRGVGALLWVIGVVAILIILTQRLMHRVSVVESVSDGERLERIAEVGFKNVLEVARWHLEYDRRVEQEKAASNADEKPADWLKDVWALGPERPWIDPDDPELLVRWRLVDAGARLNLNALVGSDGLVKEEDRLRLEQFMSELKIPDADVLVQSLCDWIDRAPPEDFKGEVASDHNAFEEDARNQPLTILAELGMVPGFTQDVLWGNEDDDSLGFANWVTLHGSKTLNANTAPAWVIMGATHHMTRSAATAIVGGRDYQPFTAIEDVKAEAGDIGTDVGPLFKVVSNHFILELEADYRGRRLKRRIFLERAGDDGTVQVIRTERRGFFRWDDDTLEAMRKAEEEILEEILLDRDNRS